MSPPRRSCVRPPDGYALLLVHTTNASNVAVMKAMEKVVGGKK
jgi:hypothetical protein